MRSKKGFSPGATNTEGERQMCMDGFESLSITDSITDDARGQEISSLLPIKRKALFFVDRAIRCKFAWGYRDGEKQRRQA